MDATQMIDDSVLESDEEEQEEEENNARGDPLGKLCILKNPHIPEKECPLYLGENVLGRDPNTCSLSFLAPSVSKQHATISVSVYRRRGCKDQVEALLWDMGSMNGTRKGHLKLTPRVRYALSEGDSFVVADIPCKYMKCSADVQDTRTPVTPNLKTRDVLRENGGNVNTSKTKSPAASTIKDAIADAESTRGTPDRTGGLSFEQTPTQPQSSLVPESESDSEEDKSRAGDRRRKNIVSDSDSYKSSPTCSTFMSPTNKVVPESEDESPITPSSSYKNRTRRVSFNTEESDSDFNRQEQKKIVPLDLVDDSEEETGNDNKTSVDNSSVQPQISKVEPNVGVQAKAVPEFNMDSDTDVEEDEEKPTADKAATTTAVTSSNAQPESEFHMDSDTDVEDNEPPISSDNIPEKHQNIPVVQPEGISLDSDTDVEEEEEKPAKTSVAPEISNNVQASNAAEFNMDSDTDVEDEDLVSAALEKPTESQTAKLEMPKTSEINFNLDADTDVDEEEADITATPSHLDAKTPISKSAAPQDVQLESDTDDEGIINVPVASKPPEDLELLSNSDTDVEDGSADVKPTASGLTVAECEVDSVEGAGLIKAIVSENTGDKAAPVSADSDTDVEDNENEIKETGDNEIPALQREITPDIQGASLKNCSTPIQQQEGKMEEMETQAFLNPSISAYRRAVAPVRSDALSSCSSQEDDYAVAETQSFILNDRAQDPNTSVGSDSSVKEKDVSSTSGGHFHLELSDTSVLQNLTMESTQAYINANLEETQPYADAIITAAKSTPADIALQATQAYIPMQDSEEEEEGSEGGKQAKNDEGAEEEEEEEATQLVDFLSAAPTQPMCVDEESDDEDDGVFRTKKAKQIHEMATQMFTTVDVAPTQPMEIQDDSETDEDVDVSSKKISEENEEETQANSDVTIAQTVPMEMQEDSESDEDFGVFKKKKVAKIQEEDTQQNSDLIDTQTVPMEMPGDSESDDDGPVFKRRTAKQLQSEEEASQEIHKDEGTDDEDSGPIFRKRKVKRVDRIEDTQPSLESEITVDPTQPIPTNEESDEEELIPIGEKTAKTTKKKVESELAVAPTQPVVLSEDEENEEDVFPAPRKRKARKLEDTQQQNSQADIDDGKESGEGSSVGVRGTRSGRSKIGKEKQNEELVVEPTKRQTRGKTKATPVSKGRRRRGKVEPESEEEEEEEEEEKANKMAAKVQKEKEDKEKSKREELERLEKERIEQEQKVARIQKEKEERERLEKEKKEREEMERLELEKREREEKERLEKEREEKERLEKERIEQEKEEQAAKLQKEKEEKERKEKERLEKERIKQEKKEQAAKLRKEKEEKKQREKEERERAEKEREEKERSEAAKKAEEEARERVKMEEEARLEKEKQKEEDQALRRGRKKEEKEEEKGKQSRWKRRATTSQFSKEGGSRKRKRQAKKFTKEGTDERSPKRKRKKAKLRKEKEEKKQRRKKTERAEKRKRKRDRKQPKKRRGGEERVKMEEEARLEKEKQKEEDQALRRGRRTGRRTIAAPESSSSTVADEDDVPAKRTRSRSNSSTSVGSERSLSSDVSQTTRGRGRGRGRGGRKTEVQVEKAPSRGRRRTVAATEAPPSSPPRTLSRSNSNTSLNSELSVNSVSSQGRGRGGRQRGRGRGRKSEIEQVSTENNSQRGRKSTRTCPKDDDEDEGDSNQPSVSTRGKRGAKDNTSKTPENDEEQGDALTSSTERRKASTKQTETKNESKTTASQVEDEQKDEDKDASLSGKRKAAARNPPTRKSMKVEEDDAKTDKPKARGRASTVQAKSVEEHGDSGSSANNSVEQEEPPQTPKSSVSRKRSSPDSESDPLAKTPRSSTASPSVSRSRAASQSYKVLFTGVVDEAGEKVLTRLGGAIAKDVFDMNYLVTDKVRRTVKFLCAVAKGVPIVTTAWLEKSGKAGSFLCPSTYLVKDREQENKFEFNLQESLNVANSQPLLQGYEIHVTKSVKPEPVQMKDIISCSGAVFLPRMPTSKKPNTVVISCEDDWSLCAPALSCGLPVVSSEFILTGILQQKVDLEKHKLHGPESAPTTGGRGKGRKKT
ncbi:mediator of DNA damage checkpoint protein 1 [Boleophthalmus pectinirostris]|uniref:mediator of DNA damage checkpoint protein 1 n=1 Tax=Boleophthalmus pectinirostris TaxID=150288 RepID=UPI002431B09F|nr:mediator of DNA damage checkpoint protein 1 [Boleophthalmus pectinirostris]